jgi:hypothetical protein
MIYGAARWLLGLAADAAEGIAEHLGAIRALAGDGHNLLTHHVVADVIDDAFARVPRQRPAPQNAKTSAAPETPDHITASGEAAESPSGPELRAHSPEGRLNVGATGKLLRVSARGIRDWIHGDPCTAPAYWASVAAALDRVAQAQDAINLATK